MARMRLVSVLVAAAGFTGRCIAAQDTLVVHADREPLWGSSLKLVEELRIGVVEGSEHVTFGRLTAAAVGPSGEMVTVDQQGPLLRLFDSAGNYVRAIGRRGQGPGEYLQVSGARFTPDGKLAIWDPGNHRITTYAAGGEVAATIPVSTTLQGGDQSFQVDTAGCFYVLAAGSVKDHVISQFIWIKIGPDGEVLDSLPIPPSDGVGRPLTLLTIGGPLTPFRIETVSALSPYGYEVTGRTDVYAIWRPLPDGRVLRIDGRSRRVEVGGEERAQWKALLDYMESVSRSTTDQFEPIPSQKPAFRALWVDEGGRIWVHRYVSAVHVPRPSARRPERPGPPTPEWVEPPVWDAYDERGALLGSIALPMKAILVASRGSRVWVIEHGALDESYLVRYRINGGGAKDPLM